MIWTRFSGFEDGEEKAVVARVRNWLRGDCIVEIYHERGVRDMQNVLRMIGHVICCIPCVCL